MPHAKGAEDAKEWKQRLDGSPARERRDPGMLGTEWLTHSRDH